ncbi:MAG: copper homeostasis protein CutC [Bacteroidales bacterium]|nr:copper homeostasis protein CutC [Bacteroidales bacterium]MCI5619622.1 copper homeostasis protein CutC [Rikenellaceae bacterium]
MGRYFREACCPSAEAAGIAAKNGASRVELCESLEIGGVTPSQKMMEQVLKENPGLCVNVLVRPRGGDFIFSEDEIQTMLKDIRLCKSLGVNGVVIGALRPDGGVDMACMRRLIEEARPLSITFHRAFDECSDVRDCLEDVIALGCDRLLTSGHEKNALEGRFTIAELVKQAAGRIIIMAGCGVRPSNINIIAESTKAEEYHSSTLLGWD